MLKTGSSDIISQCQEFFNFPDISELIFHRKRKFNSRSTITDNYYVTLINLNSRQLINVVTCGLCICWLSTFISTLLLCVHVYVLCMFYCVCVFVIMFLFYLIAGCRKVNKVVYITSIHTFPPMLGWLSNHQRTNLSYIRFPQHSFVLDVDRLLPLTVRYYKRHH